MTIKPENSFISTSIDKIMLNDRKIKRKRKNIDNMIDNKKPKILEDIEKLENPEECEQIVPETFEDVYSLKHVIVKNNIEIVKKSKNKIKELNENEKKMVEFLFDFNTIPEYKKMDKVQHSPNLIRKNIKYQEKFTERENNNIHISKSNQRI